MFLWIRSPYDTDFISSLEDKKTPVACTIPSAIRTVLFYRKSFCLTHKSVLNCVVHHIVKTDIQGTSYIAV